MYKKHMLEGFVGRLDEEGKLSEDTIRSFRERIRSLPFDERDMVTGAAAEVVFSGHSHLPERLSNEWLDFIEPGDGDDLRSFSGGTQEPLN